MMFMEGSEIWVVIDFYLIAWAGCELNSCFGFIERLSIIFLR